MYRDRFDRVRGRMTALGVDVLLLSTGADLPWLSGYEALETERLTMLVLPRDGAATLVVPRLEAARVEEQPDAFRVHVWDETDDPVAEVAELAGARPTAAIGDHTWARFLLELQRALPRTRFRKASEVTAPLRRVKDAAEVDALRAAARAVDGMVDDMRGRPFAGRTEADVHRELVQRMLDAGHERANFAIVGSGPNGASPHHEAGGRTIEHGDVVVCDFGGSMRHYCSDITRVFVVGEPSPEVRDTYAALADAQEKAVHAATVGTPCEDVDATARRIIADAGFGDRFIHRTGHGIGVETHEDPYIVAGNAAPLEPGNVFSVEPGIYLPGRFGLRVEDIVVATPDGPERLNHASRDLAVVD
jgi:D-alanyl-D-alanine dipeptidase